MGLILIVDDEPSVLELTSRVLRQAGHEVVTAATGTEAFPLLVDDGVDVVVVDLHLPDMSGPEFIEAARLKNPDVGAVIISGRPELLDETFLARMRALELDAYLAKPFKTLDEVRTLVARAVAGKHRRRVNRQVNHTLDEVARKAPSAG